MSCLHPECAAAARTRGYCERHYRLRLHTGRYGYRDAARARAHVAALRALGWTFEAIAAAAGLSTYVPHRLHTGQTRRLLAESERALLRIALVRHESHRGVDATGSRRRVQALAWMGWPNHEIARRIGCSPRTLPSELSRGSLSVRLAHRIVDVYEELAAVPGPSRYAAAKARQHRFVSPWAWDDDTIDDPKARPHGARTQESA